MDVKDVNGLHAEVKRRMDGAIEHIRKELAGLRSGRATPAILDPVQVEAYGAMVPLNQVAQLSVPEATLIVEVIRIPIPPLTEERRKELSKLVHKYSEESRNAVRQVRRDANDRLKKLLKDHAISEDDERRALDQVQKITDQHVVMIDDLQKKKDQELLGK
jgi:ribosome recycling factor